MPSRMTNEQEFVGSVLAGMIFVLIIISSYFMFVATPAAVEEEQNKWIEAAKQHNAGKYILDEEDKKVFKWNDELTGGRYE